MTVTTGGCAQDDGDIADYCLVVPRILATMIMMPSWPRLPMSRGLYGASPDGGGVGSISTQLFWRSFETLLPGE